MSLLHLDKSTFDTEIKEGKTLVDFWAPWCGPCRMLGPVIESMAEGRTDGVKIAKVNVDENPEIAQRFRVYSKRYNNSKEEVFYLCRILIKELMN